MSTTRELARRMSARLLGIVIGVHAKCGYRHRSDAPFPIRVRFSSTPSLLPPLPCPVLVQAEIRLDKPDTTVRCPISNEPLRLKQLVPVKFTRADEGASSDDLVGMNAKERYICPLTKKRLSNIHPATVLKPSGMVISSSCVKDIIKKVRALRGCGELMGGECQRGDGRRG